MQQLKIAILGCGTVGGGVAKILLENSNELSTRVSGGVSIKTIVDLHPSAAAEKYNIPISLFAGNGANLTKEQASQCIEQVIQDEEIGLVVETIGGSGDFIYNLAVGVLNAGKHLVTANKALLAIRGQGIFDAAIQKGKIVGFEAAVCGAIPIIKTIKESFSGDEIISVSGIMNGTSNYILSMMQHEGLEFNEALKLAQDNGYAEADPTLDVNGGDAGHKINILIKLAFGVDVKMDQLSIQGIQHIEKDDMDFASEIDCSIKLICYAKKEDNKIYATVSPMMVKNSNFLSGVNGATNAVRVINRYGGKHILVGAGAGSSETASSIVGDIVYIARYAGSMKNYFPKNNYLLLEASHFVFPYIVTFETDDTPGITGLITTAIGKQHINIDTVSHNRHKKEKAIFSVATTPCTLLQIEAAIKEIKKGGPDILLSEPKVLPILY